MIKFFHISLLLFTCTLCKSADKEIVKLNSELTYTAIIEIPAGTNKKFEYNYQTNKFECEIINGKERTIDYLPYPGNYGYILDTYMDPKLGGDGDALDVLVISETLTQGTEINIKPVAILKLLDDGEEDHKIIAVPSKSVLTFMNDSVPKSVQQIITSWFCNYKGANKMTFISWGNEYDAIEEIKKWYN